MTESSDDEDLELIAEFVDEALDSLESVSSLFVALEKDLTNTGLINDIFRPVHTIKGNAAFLHLEAVTEFAHELETLMDAMRNGVVECTPGMITLLLQGIDELRAMLSRVRSQQAEIADPNSYRVLLLSVQAATSHGTKAGAPTETLWNDLDKLVDALTRIGDASIAECTGKIRAVIDMIRSAIDTGEHSQSEARLMDPKQICGLRDRMVRVVADPSAKYEVERLISNLNEIEPHAQSFHINAYFNHARSATQALMASNEGDDDHLDVIEEFVSATVEFLSQDCWQPYLRRIRAKASAASTGDEADAPKKKESARTMRVAEDRIDVFLDYVGELIVIRQMFESFEGKVSDQLDQDVVKDLHDLNKSFAVLADDLQSSIMEIRKLPVKAVLQKAPRIVRDVANSKEKDIDVKLTGDELRIDKSILDSIEGPLTHIVRNAADHGIEAPDEREAQGKPRRGTVRVVVQESDKWIEVTISDDGKGLDFEAIRQKAVTMGVLKESQHLSENELKQLVFLSGLSTAETITDISGRGVGMDVVKRDIETVGGEIRVESTVGAGSEFTVRLPMGITTQIIDGFLVRSDDHRFVIPVERILESFQLASDELASMVGQLECVKRRDDWLPLLRLGAALSTRKANRVAGAGGGIGSADGVFIAVTANRKRLVVHVDEILGCHQVVIRPLTGPGNEVRLFSGGAIMGDGMISMVLNVDELPRLFPETAARSTQASSALEPALA